MRAFLFKKIMAENKNSFILFTELIDVVELMSDDTAGKFIKHILQYVNDLDPQTDNKEILLSFIPVKQNLKRQLKKWEEIKEKRSIAGQISAEKRKQNSTNSTRVEFVEQTSTNSTVNVNDNVTVNVNDNVKEFLLKKETKKDSLKKANEIILPFQTPTFEKAWNEWKQYKEIELKFKFKSIISEAMALTELKKLSRNLEKTAIEIIYQSITNGWKGLFELKNQTNGNTTSNTKPTAQQQLEEVKRSMRQQVDEAFKNVEH